VIVDAVAVSDGGASDKTYAPVISSASGSQVAAISRLVGNSARSSATAWFGGWLSGASTNLTYDVSGASANMPAGAALTPGAENAQGAPATPDAGSPVVDAGAPVVDAGPRDAGAPVVDAGPRDAGSPTATDAGGTTGTDAGVRDAGTDAGARDAGAVPAEQTFGEGESGCGCAVVGSERRSTQPFAWVALGGFALLVARRRRSR
jgi:MYXO-CTERM domain-containing protein